MGKIPLPKLSRKANILLLLLSSVVFTVSSHDHGRREQDFVENSGHSLIINYVFRFPMLAFKEFDEQSVVFITPRAVLSSLTFHLLKFSNTQLILIIKNILGYFIC